MKRGIGKHIKQNFRQISEDLQVLQKQMRHNSVYSKRIIGLHNRKPKHPKQLERLTGSYS